MRMVLGAREAGANRTGNEAGKKRSAGGGHASSYRLTGADYQIDMTFEFLRRKRRFDRCRLKHIEAGEKISPAALQNAA
jgi:hypothetical protein